MIKPNEANTFNTFNTIHKRKSFNSRNTFNVDTFFKKHRMRACHVRLVIFATERVVRPPVALGVYGEAAIGIREAKRQCSVR